MIELSHRDQLAMNCPPTETLGNFNSIEAVAEWIGIPIPQTSDEMINLAVKARAKIAYAYADAMIAESNQEPKG